MNTHLRGDNTEMQEARPSELGGSPYYLDEDMEAQRGGLREVIFKSGAVVFLLSHPASVIKNSFIILFTKAGCKLMRFRKCLPGVETNSIFRFNHLLLVERLQGQYFGYVKRIKMHRKDRGVTG